ncbi:MAG: acyltransferase family protein [Treponemataceae bacterium]|nr:acyltransferase family protein [Spirochaetales bacterium]MDY6030136.1 acyltransferase family protein [Treponemataceae bacterium]
MREEVKVIETEKKNFRYISVLRIIAMFSVIMIHSVCTPVTYYSESYSHLELQISCILRSVFISFAVPIFLMISGALFLNPSKDISTNKILTKYVKRIFLDILIFGSIFALMEIVFTNKHFSPIDILTALKNALTGNTWGHLWYLYLIISLYLVTPVFRAFAKNSEKKDFLIVLGIIYFFTMVLPLISSILNIKTGFYVPFTTASFFYLAGHAVHTDMIKLKNWHCLLLIILSFVYIIGMSFVKNSLIIYGAQIKNVSWLGIMTVPLYCLVKNLVTNNNERKIETFLASMSFGVYIFHAVFLNFIYKATPFTPVNYPLVLVVSIAFVITSIFSIFVTWIFKKIPYLNKLV